MSQRGKFFSSTKGDSIEESREIILGLIETENNAKIL